MILPVVAGLLLLVSFLAALGSYSLRGFSYSRLDEICQQHKRPERFGAVLRAYDESLLATELLHLVSTFAFIVCAAEWLDWEWRAGHELPGWFALAAEIAVSMAALAFAIVILPWTVARVSGEKYLYHVWPAIVVLRTLLGPFMWVAARVDRLAHRVTGRKEPDEEAAEVITEEIRSVVDEGQREGVLEPGARTMIHRVMELQDEDVGAIMTPRTEMVTLDAGASLEEARRRLLEAGHSRVPVIGESTDDIIGVLYAKDLLRWLDAGESNGQPPPLTEIVREPLYIPETTGIATLLETMKRKRVQMAVVLDEYGGVAGLVTMEDILEEIVGEIVDEYDVEEAALIHPISRHVVEADARAHIDDLNEQFDYDLPEDEDYDTIGGFVFSQLGRVPVSGDTIVWNRLRILVLDADKRKINRLRIEVDPTLTAAAAEEG